MSVCCLSWPQFCFQIGFQAIAEALGLAAVKALVAIAAIIAGGRLVGHALIHPCLNSCLWNFLQFSLF